MNNFNEMLTGILSEKANKDGLFGVKINDKGTTIFFKDGSEQKRVKKVIDSYKTKNPSAGDKALMRLAGVAVKLANTPVKDIIAVYDCSTGDCYKDFLNIGKESD